MNGKVNVSDRIIPQRTSVTGSDVIEKSNRRGIFEAILEKTPDFLL
jgi:hypothetical protein